MNSAHHLKYKNYGSKFYCYLRRLLLCIFVAVFLVGPAFAGEIFDKTIKEKLLQR
jgi:hypothetical protein